MNSVFIFKNVSNTEVFTLKLIRPENLFWFAIALCKNTIQSLIYIIEIKLTFLSFFLSFFELFTVLIWIGFQLADDPAFSTHQHDMHNLEPVYKIYYWTGIIWQLLVAKYDKIAISSFKLKSPPEKKTKKLSI